MSTINLTPLDYGDYLKQQRAEPRQAVARCSGCLRELDCWLFRRPDLNPDELCDECARRYHAFDVQEEQTVRSLLTKLDPLAWRTIIELADMTEDDWVPRLVHAVCTELLQRTS